MSVAKNVTCSPEMLMRWPMPVRLNMRHCSAGIARSSPIASAENPRRDRFAQSSDIVARPSRERIEPPVALAVAHVAGCAKLVLEQPRLDIEAVRIDCAVRALETHRERPALAAMQLRKVFA